MYVVSLFCFYTSTTLAFLGFRNLRSERDSTKLTHCNLFMNCFLRFSWFDPSGRRNFVFLDGKRCKESFNAIFMSLILILKFDYLEITLHPIAELR